MWGFGVVCFGGGGGEINTMGATPIHRAVHASTDMHACMHTYLDMAPPQIAVCRRRLRLIIVLFEGGVCQRRLRLLSMSMVESTPFYTLSVSSQPPPHHIYIYIYSLSVVTPTHPPTHI